MLRLQPHYKTIMTTDPVVQIVTYALSIGIVLLQVYAVFGVSMFFAKNNKFFAFTNKYFVAFAFALSFIAMCGSLFYSEYAHFNPCVLCWYQRILMYSQAVITLVALFRKYRTEITDYILGLSFIGAIIAAYHYNGQVIHPGTLPCAATIAASSCNYIPNITFGYITIPLMAFTVFVVLIVLSLGYKYRRHA